MSSRSTTKAVAAALLAGAAMSACSDIYFDRRETIALHSGDAMATNRVTHTIDPWSPASANRNIAFNGEKMQTAHERYRTGKIIPPVNATTSSVAYTQAQQAAQSSANSQAASAPGTSSNNNSISIKP
jgi:hypothetical protein